MFKQLSVKWNQDAGSGGHSNASTQTPPADNPSTQNPSAGGASSDLNNSQATAGGTPPASGASSTSSGGGSAPPPNNNSTTTPDWTTGLSEELRGYAQTKGFKDPSMTVDAYRNLEKLVGQREKLLVVPDKPDDLKSLNDIATRLGKPAKAEDYGIKFAENASAEYRTQINTLLHEAQLTKSQANFLVEKFDGMTKAQQDAATQNFQNNLKAGREALQKEWGAAYQQNEADAKAAVRALGVKPEVVDQIENNLGLGYVETMKFFAELGKKVGEPRFVNGASGSSNREMSPSEAKQAIDALQSDQEFMNKYLSGGTAEIERMRVLHSFSAPGKINL